MSVNKSLEDKCLELNKEIKELKEYKEYQKAKKLLLESSKLNSIKNNLEKMKHIMCNCNDELIKEEYLKNLNTYNSSPLVINYRIWEERLEIVVETVMQSINDRL